jgi:hypothetical protein
MEELQPRTPANGGHGGQWRRKRPIGPHRGSTRDARACLAPRKGWQRGWQEESEGGVAVERERRCGGVWRR